MIINLTVGRGKTGKAKTGPPRMLFQDQEDLAKWSTFVSDCLKYAEEKYGKLDDEARQAFRDNTYRSILGRELPDVYELKTVFGWSLFFVNRSTLDPRISAEREINRLQEQ